MRAFVIIFKHPKGEQHWCCETSSIFLRGGGGFRMRDLIMESIRPILAKMKLN